MTIDRRLLRITLGAATIAAVTSTPAVSSAGDLFGREGLYDLTGNPALRDLRLDYEYIRAEKPSYAELRGLAGAPTVQVRRNFIYLQDTDGTLTIPYQEFRDLNESFNWSLREIYRVLPDEFVFVYLFTSFRTGVGAFFYQPEANDVRGMGQQTFDMNGGSAREGFVFMNWWRSFEESFGAGGQAFVQAQARSVFNQEAGHRWGSFVQAGAGLNGGGADVLLGRDDSHWSYFLNTGGSPMEGNGWRDNGNGTFTTSTTFMNWRFSPLDLYLMGLIPATEVPSMFVIANPNVSGQRDLFNDVIHAGSPPQIFDPVSVSGTRVDITIDSIIARNGIRSPAVGASPTRWRVVFAMLAGRNNGLNESQLAAFEEMVDDYALGFKQGTGDRGELDYLLNDVPKVPIGGTCLMTAECDALEASVCLIVPPASPDQGLCTRPCSSAGSCPQDWCCQPAASGVEVCLPQGMCTTTAPPDGGVSEGPDSGMSMEPVVCTCDLTTGCDEGCGHCDPECAPAGPCSCDVTFGCDLDGRGSECACDLECTGASASGCSCLAAEEKLPERGGAGAAAAGAFAAAAVLVLALRRRRR